MSPLTKRDKKVRRQNRTMTPTDRHNLISDLLRRSDPMSVTEIMNRLNTQHGTSFNRKMIDRDVRDMSVSFSIIDDEQKPARFSIDKAMDKREVSLSLTEEHLQILSLALTSLKAFSSLNAKSIETENAILACLPEDLKLRMRASEHSWVLQPAQGGVRKDLTGDTIEAILYALRKGCALRGVYASKGEGAKKARWIAPVRVEISGNGLSLLARDLESPGKEIKRWVPARFEKVKVDLEHQEPTVSMKELKPFISTLGAFGGPSQTPEAITLRVGSSVGEHLMEVEYHPTQKVKRIGDKSYVVTMKVPIGWPLIRLVASFGGDMEDIQPAELKERVNDIWAGGNRAMKTVRGLKD